MESARLQSTVQAPPASGDASEAARQNRIAQMREQQRRRRQQMSGQIDMNQQSDLMKKFEENLL